MQVKNIDKNVLALSNPDVDYESSGVAKDIPHHLVLIVSQVYC